MKMKEKSEKVGLKLNIQQTKIMSSSPITSWQIDGQTMETVRDFIFGGSKITADGDCSHEIKRCLLLGRKAMTNLDSILKSRDFTLPTKVRLVKAMVFPVIVYGCESWTVKKAECCIVREDLRVPWSARRSNQSNLKEISPWILTGRTDAEAETLILWPPDIKNWFEKTLMLGKIEDRRKRGQRGWNGWMATPTWWMWVWVRFRSWTGWWTGKPGMLQSMGLQRVSHDLATELNSTDTRILSSHLNLLAGIFS